MGENHLKDNLHHNGNCKSMVTSQRAYACPSCFAVVVHFVLKAVVKEQHTVLLPSLGHVADPKQSAGLPFCRSRYD